jgi:hypothetical protein
MSVKFAKYTIVGNEEDVLAFEAVMLHIKECCQRGMSRDITIKVDGDGSASLRFYRDNPDENEENNTVLEKSKAIFTSGAEAVEYATESDIARGFFRGEKMHLKGGIGTIHENGNGTYYIGE